MMCLDVLDGSANETFRCFSFFFSPFFFLVLLRARVCLRCFSPIVSHLFFPEMAEDLLVNPWKCSAENCNESAATATEMVSKFGCYDVDDKTVCFFNTCTNCNKDVLVTCSCKVEAVKHEEAVLKFGPDYDDPARAISGRGRKSTDPLKLKVRCLSCQEKHEEEEQAKKEKAEKEQDKKKREQTSPAIVDYSFYKNNDYGTVLTEEQVEKVINHYEDEINAGLFESVASSLLSLTLKEYPNFWMENVPMGDKTLLIFRRVAPDVGGNPTISRLTIDGEFKQLARLEFVTAIENSIKDALARLGKKADSLGLPAHWMCTTLLDFGKTNPEEEALKKVESASKKIKSHATPVKGIASPKSAAGKSSKSPTIKKEKK